MPPPGSRRWTGQCFSPVFTTSLGESGIKGTEEEGSGPGTSGAVSTLEKLLIQAQFPADSRDPGSSAHKDLTNGRKLRSGDARERAGYLSREPAGLN